MKEIIVTKFDNTTIRLTTKQVRAIMKLWKRGSGTPSETFREYVNQAFSTIGCDGAVVVPFNFMWIAIEKDGYAHS